MIQRVQTIFMFFAVVAILAVLFLPFYKKVGATNEDGQEYVMVNAFQVSYERDLDGEIEILAQESTIVISIVAIVAAAVMLFSIFQYKKRINQVKLNALFSLLVACTIGGMAYYTTKANEIINPELGGYYLPAFYFPIAAMFNNFLANRFIRKDEKLVRSADRLR